MYVCMYVCVCVCVCVCAAGDFEGSVGKSVCTGSCPTGKYSEVTGATSADTCKECPIGTYGNTTGASSCAACPVAETTTDKGNSDPAACECITGYTRDCTTQVCTVSGARYYASACAAASSPQVSKVVFWAGVRNRGALLCKCVRSMPGRRQLRWVRPSVLPNGLLQVSPHDRYQACLPPVPRGEEMFLQEIQNNDK